MDQAALAEAIGSAGGVTLLAGPGLAAEAGVAPRPATLDWSLYGPRMALIHAAEPGTGHRAARRLQDLGLLGGVVSEGDDVLFQEAGVRDVIAPVGSVELSICPGCGYSEPLGCLLDLLPLPWCAACGEVLRPDVAPVGSGPRPAAMARAREVVGAARLLVVAGNPSPPIGSLADAAAAVVVLADHRPGPVLAAAAEALGR
jgi:NAD-dependent deacetylase